MTDPNTGETPPVPYNEYHDERDTEAFWEAIKPDHEPIQIRWYMPLVILLLVICTPWYWLKDAEVPVIAGLPLWVWITIATTAALAVVTALMIIFAWRDDPQPNEDDPSS